MIIQFRSKYGCQSGSSFTEALILISLMVVLVLAAVRSFGQAQARSLITVSACMGGGSATTMKPPVGGSTPPEPEEICPFEINIAPSGGPDSVQEPEANAQAKRAEP